MDLSSQQRIPGLKVAAYSYTASWVAGIVLIGFAAASSVRMPMG